MKKQRNYFTNFAATAAEYTGRPLAFLFAVASVIIWACTGPMFHFSDTWQMVINTGTTIVTFLLVFLIQNSQNRDTRAIQIKVDELIRVTKGAHTSLLDLEKLTDEEICEIASKYEVIAEESRRRIRQGMDDVHVPDVDIGHKKPCKRKSR